MAKILTEVDTFSASIVVPEDGDTRDAASVETPLQSLANRTKNLKARVDVIGAAETVTRMGEVVRRSIPSSFPAGWEEYAGAWRSTVNSSGIQIWVNELLTHGAELTSVAVRVVPGAARAGANRTRVRVYRCTGDYGVFTLLSGSSDYDDGTAADQLITSVATPGHTIDTESYLYLAELDAGSTGAASPDTIYGGVICVCAKPLIA